MFGGPGQDAMFGGQDSDLVDGGPGEDLLVGDLPGMTESGLPPTVDPNPNFDRCIGAAGTDTALLCEQTIGVESPG